MHDQEIEEQIGRSIVGFINADIPEGDVGWEIFLRIRVKLDIQKPLPRGCFINVNSQKLWISIRYEKLPNICFNYGLIDHGNQRYEPSIMKSTNSIDSLQFEYWLRATTGKGAISIASRQPVSNSSRSPSNAHSSKKNLNMDMSSESRIK